MTDIIETIKKGIAKNRALLKDLNAQGKKIDSDKLSSLKNGVKEVSDSFGSIKFREDVVGYYTNAIRRDLTQIDDGNAITSDIESTIKELKEKIGLYIDVKEEVSSLSEDYQDLLKGIEFESKNASITEMLDTIASSLENKGFIDDAIALDKIANTIEANMGDLRSLKKEVRKKSVTPDFRETKRRLISTLRSRPRTLEILMSIKNLSPQDSIRAIIQKLGGKVDRGSLNRARPIAIKLMSRADGKLEGDTTVKNTVAIEAYQKEAYQKEAYQKEAYQKEDTIDTSDLTDLSVVLLSLLSSMSGTPIEEMSYQGLVSTLRPYLPKI